MSWLARRSHLLVLSALLAFAWLAFPQGGLANPQPPTDKPASPNLLSKLEFPSRTKARAASATTNDFLKLAAQPEQIERGRLLYMRNCFICHQLNGQGISGAYPPLAKSDFLMANRKRSIHILCAGLSGGIVVNGKKYDSFMSVFILDDPEVADVLTYVRNSWGNSDAAITPEEVKSVRATTQFSTFASLEKNGSFAPLPAPPKGFTLREVARLPVNGVRMASDGEGKAIYVLCVNGDVYRLEPAGGTLRKVLTAQKYLEHHYRDLGDPIFILGLAMDKEKRLYIAVNQQNGALRPFRNMVTIYRASLGPEGDPVSPQPWFRASYPGNFAYVHALENIAFGPDGFLYAGNGARTDGGLTGGGGRDWSNKGETPITSCIWRIDPEAKKPKLEVFARGIRNAYGFCWNDKGEMFATENGPDAHAPEELNLIERGKHYGFPYRFSDWTTKAYPKSPDAPAGLEFTLPIANLGPDGGFEGKALYTFDPHSSPGGIVFLGNDFPEGWRGTFLLTRFGNFIRQPKDNVGFDLLQAKLEKNSQGIYEAHIYRVLAPLGRPIDVHVSGKGKVYICEYSRPTNNNFSYSLPGRILELAVEPGGR